MIFAWAQTKSRIYFLWYRSTHEFQQFSYATFSYQFYNKYQQEWCWQAPVGLFVLLLLQLLTTLVYPELDLRSRVTEPMARHNRMKIGYLGQLPLINLNSRAWATVVKDLVRARTGIFQWIVFWTLVYAD